MACRHVASRSTSPGGLTPRWEHAHERSLHPVRLPDDRGADHDVHPRGRLARRRRVAGARRTGRNGLVSTDAGIDPRAGHGGSHQREPHCRLQYIDVAVRGPDDGASRNGVDQELLGARDDRRHRSVCMEQRADRGRRILRRHVRYVGRFDARRELRRYAAQCARLHHEPRNARLPHPGRLAGNDTGLRAAGFGRVRRQPLQRVRRRLSASGDDRGADRGHHGAMKNHRRCRSQYIVRNVRSEGFTLVELMVALAIGSVLLLALAAMFIGTSQSRNELDKSSRQIEGGRYAVQVLSDEIRHAGYYGPLTTAPTLPGSVTALPNPCLTTLTTVQNSLGLPVQGYAGGASAPASVTCLDAAAGYKANTGIIVVRRADTTIAAAAPTSPYFNIQTSGCAGDAIKYVFDSYANAGNFTLH